VSIDNDMTDRIGNSIGWASIPVGVGSLFDVLPVWAFVSMVAVALCILAAGRFLPYADDEDSDDVTD
jgi:hypothetical protein